MKLSVLIPSLPERAPLLARLLSVLSPQVVSGVEVLINLDAKDQTRGKKRNRLLDAAQGDFVTFIDDDDLISPDYVSALLGAMATAPDCICFGVGRTFNGETEGRQVHSLKFRIYTKRWNGREFIYQRPPNHLSAIKRELAVRTRFDEGPVEFEDVDFALRLRPILSTSIEITNVLYHYQRADKCS